MTILIVTIVSIWVLFSGILVTLVCMNSSRLSYLDEPFKTKAKLARARRIQRQADPQPTMAPANAEI